MTEAESDQAPLFAVIGEALIDLVDDGNGEAYVVHPGGSPFNVAIGLARLGQPTAFLGRFSTDPFGGILRDYATRSGLDISLAASGNEPSTLAVVTLDGDRVPRYTFHTEGTVDWRWRDEDLPVLPPRTGFVHVGSLASWMPPGDDAIDRRFTALRNSGDTVLTYDPNVRPQFLPDVNESRAKIERFIANAHIVKVSDEDLGWIYPGGQPESIARLWLRSGPDLVVVTHGGRGSTAFVRDLEPVRRPAYATSVVDTVGAGDAFMTGLLDSLARGTISSPTCLPALTRNPKALSDLLDDAALVAGIACSRHGGGPPWRSEVERQSARSGRPADPSRPVQGQLPDLEPSGSSEYDGDRECIG